MGVTLVQHCLSPLAFMSMIGAIALNVGVLTMCNFLVLPSDASVGLFAYQPVDAANCFLYNTNERPNDGILNDSKVKTARAGSFLAVIFGTITFVLLLIKRFCRPIPYEIFVFGICFLLIQIFISLTWMVYHTTLCQLYGCTWGKAATVNLIAQILYMISGILFGCIPDRKDFEDEYNQKR